MIKTHTGEMIEERIGDYIKVNTDKVWQVRHISNEGDDTLVRLNAPDCSYWDIHPIENPCTLLHRPFQVGDATEMKCKVKGWGDDIFKERDFVYLDRGTWEYRHKNPAWRDHPDYKPEQGDV